MAGPAPKTTTEQRERVLALVDAGLSYSEVAAEVFGDASLRGRVERTVRRERQEGRCLPSLEQLLSQLASEDSRPPDDAGAEPRAWLEELVPLFAAGLKRRLETNLPVKGRELVVLADLEQRLENKRRVERLNALARRHR